MLVTQVVKVMSLGAGSTAALRQYGWVYSTVPGKAFEKAFENRRDMVMSSITDAGSSNKKVEANFSNFEVGGSKKKKQTKWL